MFSVQKAAPLITRKSEPNL